MQTVQLHIKYKNLNAGDFAGFEDAEVAHLLGLKVPRKDGEKNIIGSAATLAVNCKVLKAFDEELAQATAKASVSHLKAEHEVGDFIVLQLAHAEAFKKAGLAEFMVPVRYRKTVGAGDARVEVGSDRSMPASEAEKLEKDGTVKVLSPKKP